MPKCKWDGCKNLTYSHTNLCSEHESIVLGKTITWETEIKMHGDSLVTVIPNNTRKLHKLKPKMMGTMIFIPWDRG